MTRRELALVVKTAALTVSAMVLLWILWSYLDVVAHNDCGGTQNAANLFRMIWA